MTSDNLTKINLLPQEILDQRRFELWYPWIISSVIIALLITGIISAILGIGLVGQEDALDQTASEIKTTNAQAAKLKQHEDEKNFLDARQAIVDSALANRLDAYLLSVALTKSLPGPISIERFVYNANKGLTIQGVVEDTGANPESRDWKGVAATIDALEGSSIIRNAWLSRGVMNDNYNAYEQFDAEIPASTQSNFPDVVDQFEISADVKVTIDTNGKTDIWTEKNAKEAGK